MFFLLRIDDDLLSEDWGKETQANWHLLLRRMDDMFMLTWTRPKQFFLLFKWLWLEIIAELHIQLHFQHDFFLSTGNVLATKLVDGFKSRGKKKTNYIHTDLRMLD